MARLSANGSELFRISREFNFSPEEHTILKNGTDLGLTLTTWERYTRAYMANGKILEKHDCLFRPDTFNPKGRSYSYGWKVYGKMKLGVNVREHVAKIRKGIEEGRSKWVIETKGMKPVIIRQAQVIAAVESGENAGFCKACGHQCDGVEPDARNYKCEECGQMEVYGVEEMLMGF